MVDGRRVVALAGYRGEERTARQGLADPAASVRATALGALARMSRLHVEDVVAALNDESSVVRRRACELSARLADGGGQLVRAMILALGDADPWVVESACFALGEAGRATPEALSRLARTAMDHADPLCRESAVAALGAIGDRRGLPAILKGTTDKAAVRRRAVLALASFEGPEVDAALARADHDRDWQVRQAAEDLRLR